MNRPILFALDDEPAVLAAVSRDLRREYGKDYRIVRAESGAEALQALRDLKLRSEEVALFLVDQRMPHMTGVDFLREAIDLFPEARRVLLTAYADTDAAIRAINEVGIDHYLMKPWDPPDEQLYPVLSDLLTEWRASFRAPFAGVKLIGYRWSADSHRAKDFLVRNLVPYRWLDVESDEEVTQLLELAGATATQLPVVLFPDGTHLVQPPNIEIAERLGLKTRPELPFYDLVIVGGGPAGLASAVYGASEGLRTLLIEREAPGGQAGTSSRIENYLGFPSGLSGRDLTKRAVDQSRKFGVEILTPLEAAGVRAEDPYRFVRLSDGSEVSCHALLVATGVSYRRLDVPGLDLLVGAGVYYGAAITEAPGCRSQDVFVVGGGNAAGQAAMYLARFARAVTILIRGASLTSSMSHYLIAQIEATSNISVRPYAQATEARGEVSLESISIADTRTGECEIVPTHAIFIFIGALPHTDWLGDEIERDEHGFVLAGLDIVHDGRRPPGWSLDRDPFWLETSLSGVFVAGDVRHHSLKRIASAVGEGAMAVQFVHRHLASL
jgi:thioredoxin reductase (NADPH)